MPAMEEALCAYLLTKTVVTSLVGTGNAARLWPLVLPQGYTVASGPAATYSIIDSDEDHTLADRTGLVQSRVQFAAFGNTLRDAIAVARAIKNCGITTLKGLSGGVDFREVSIVRGIQTFDESPTDGSGEHRYIADFDFQISYLEG